jgi:hypothetical protein
MSIFENHRYNSRNNQFNPNDKAEVYTCVYLENINSYGFILDYVPFFTSAFPFSCTRDSDSTVFTELARTPGAIGNTEYMVDYANRAGDTGTATVEMNASQVGQTFTVVYKGLGSTVKDRYQLNQLSTIPTSLGVEGDVEIVDSLQVGVGSGSTGGITDKAGDIVAEAGDIRADAGDIEATVGKVFENGLRLAEQWSPMNFILDQDFSRGMWAGGGATFVDDTASNGGVKTLRLDGNSTLRQCYYHGFNDRTGNLSDAARMPMPFSFTDGPTVYLSLSARRSSTLNGTFRFIVVEYDRLGALIGAVLLPNFDASALSDTVYRELNQVYTASSQSVGFIAVGLRIDSTATTGSLFVRGARISHVNDFMATLGQGIGRTLIASGYATSFIQYPVDQKATAGMQYVPIYQGTPFTLTTSVADYSVDGTNVFPGMCKLVIAEIVGQRTASAGYMTVSVFNRSGDISQVVIYAAAASEPVSGIYSIPVNAQTGTGGRATIRASRIVNTSASIRPIGFFI